MRATFPTSPLLPYSKLFSSRVKAPASDILAVCRQQIG